MSPDSPKKTASQPMKALPGISDQISAINYQIQKIAQTDSPVFITGEPGTEKAFAAKLVHAMSNRSQKPLYRASINKVLPNDFAMRFRQCDGGTLVLNISRRIPEDIQIALMELTRDKSFQDPMSGEIIQADVRFIITTSQKMADLVRAQELLDDLARLMERRNIEIPPLRERPEDIPALVRYATSRARETGRSKVTEGDAQVLALFRQWSWPGNAEDLLLVTAEACLNARSEKITLEDLSEEFLQEVGEERLESARKVRVVFASPKAIHIRHEEPEAGPDPDTQPDEIADEYDEEMKVDAERYQRLLKLARRLHSQSEILTKQMAGPLEGLPLQNMLADGNMDLDSEELTEQLENQLDKSLDSIMGLRRQLALLNEREQKTIETARDLYRRLLLAGEDITSVMSEPEVQNETADLANSLREMDEVIQRVSGSFPKLGAQLESKPSISALGKEEAEFVAKALRGARNQDVEGTPGTESDDSAEDMTIGDLINFVKPGGPESAARVSPDHLDTRPESEGGMDSTEVPMLQDMNDEETFRAKRKKNPGPDDTQ